MNGLFGMTLYLTVWFGGVPISCVVDTGSQATMLRESAAERLGTLGPPLFTQQMSAANGGVMTAVARKIADVGTEDVGWSDVTVLVFPNDLLIDPCIVGTDLLARQPITIDWGLRRVTPVSY